MNLPRPLRRLGVRRSGVVSSLAAVCMLGACGASTEPTGDVRTLGWTEDLRIGSVDDEATAFGQILLATVGPDGSVYVGQWQVPEVWVFAADGTPAGRLGGSGEGPGEFGSVGRLGWMGDTLWVTEGMSSAITLFDDHGRYLDRVHYSFPFPEGWSGFRPNRPLADGTFLTSPSYASDAVERGELDRIPYLRSDRDGMTLDTLAWRRLRRETLQMRLGEQSMLNTRHPFSGSALLATNPEGSEMVLVDPEPEGVDAGFSLGRISITGDTLLWRVIPCEAIPLTEEEVRDVIRKSWAESAWLHDRTTEAAYERAYLDAIELPEAFPPVSGLRLNRDGTIWLRREAVPGDSIRWEVYDSDGELRGRLSLPSRFRVMTLHDDALWVVEADELDVQYLVRLRIEPVEQVAK